MSLENNSYRLRKTCAAVEGYCKNENDVVFYEPKANALKNSCGIYVFWDINTTSYKNFFSIDVILGNS